jgi:hypothetical protein
MRREFRNQLAALRRQMPSAVEGKSDNADSNLGLWLRNTNFLISRAIPLPLHRTGGCTAFSCGQLPAPCPVSARVKQRHPLSSGNDRYDGVLPCHASAFSP